MMSDIEKLDSDKYVLVSKNMLNFKNWGLILTIISFFIYAVRKSDLTFDSVSQKSIIIQHSIDVPTSTVLLMEERQRVTLEEIKEIKQLIKNIN